MRNVVRRLHRWCGLLLVVLLLLSGLTGSLLAFEHELDEWINPALFEAQETGTPLDADQLIARIEATDPRLRVSLLLLDHRPGRSVQAQVATRPGAGGTTKPLGHNRVFIDPVTGQILGKRLWGAWVLDRAHALPLINRLHRTLTLPGRWGNWLLGGAALGWLGLSLMGLFLSLPQMTKQKDLRGSAAPRAGRWLAIKRFWQRWKPSWRIKRDAAGYRLAHDVHRAVGLWTLPLALAFAFTGVYLNLANEVFKPVVEWVATLTPPPLSVLAKTPAAGNASSDRSPTLSAVDAIERARAQLPAAAAAAFQPWHLSHVVGQGVYRIAFKEPGFRNSAWRVRSEQVFIDDRSGALRGLAGYDSGHAGDRFLAWQYPVHTGKALGWAGRALAAVGGLAVALLCAAGIWQWWLRSCKQRRPHGLAADSNHTSAPRPVVRVHQRTDSAAIGTITAAHESSTS